MIYVHDDLWPLFYTGRCKAIPGVYQQTLFLGEQEAASVAETRREGIIVFRLVVTTVAGLLAQDAKDAGFLYPSELVDYLRKQAGGRDIRDEDVVQLAYFARKRDVY